MKFKPAIAESRYIKLAVYGGPGAGKSIIALSAPGRKLAIDTEAGLIPYASLTEFDVIHTQSFGDIKQIVDELSIKPPEEETTLIIDSCSIIWSGLQQSMTESKLQSKGLRVKEGTENVQFSAIDWNIVKRWHKDILNTLMSLKCHVVCTFREVEMMNEQFQKTGETRPEAEKNSAYTFDFVGRIHGRKFTFTKGRLARDARLIDLIGRTVSIPAVDKGNELSSIWTALFGEKSEAPKVAHPEMSEAKGKDIEKDPEALKLAHEIRSSLAPKAGIDNDGLKLYCTNKVMADGVTKFSELDADGEFHLSALSLDRLNWLADVLRNQKSAMALTQKVDELKKGKL